MKKVVCINNQDLNETNGDLTVGKVYDVNDSFTESSWYDLKNDKGIIQLYDKHRFMDIIDYRNDKLNEILKSTTKFHQSLSKILNINTIKIQFLPISTIKSPFNRHDHYHNNLIPPYKITLPV